MAYRTLHVDMAGILDAMGVGESDPMCHYLDLRTGKVEMQIEGDFWDEEAEDPLTLAIEEDPDRYEEIPKRSARDDFALMCRFADSIDEEDIRALLEVALQGKGAFSRFRDVVYRYDDLRAQWNDLREKALLDDAKDWLHALEIEPVYALRSVGPPEPAQAPTTEQRPARIELLDVLLLGAPDGKAEPSYGRVLRQVPARDPSHARALFKGLAMDLCAYYGLPWRKRHIQGKSAFDVDRAHLRIEGNTVELEIDVPPALWKAFASGRPR